MTVSVVIPVLNEARALPATLDAALSQAGLHEVIVVDGGSSDETCAVVGEFSDRAPGLRLISSARGRGRQMNAGARAATGEWLLFLHADTLLPPDAISMIPEQACARGALAGCFRQRFSAANIPLRLISVAHNLRFHLTGVIYGDQAMFIRADLFRKLGGFPQQQMEDVMISERLRNKTRPIMLPAAVVTDSRKFKQIGEFRALWWVLGILFNYELGRPVGHQKFFGDYR
jgi:rSAM/selenodomain-associated transferase 2